MRFTQVQSAPRALQMTQLNYLKAEGGAGATSFGASGERFRPARIGKRGERERERAVIDFLPAPW
jgi:hypothetical protein